MSGAEIPMPQGGLANLLLLANPDLAAQQQALATRRAFAEDLLSQPSPPSAYPAGALASMGNKLIGALMTRNANKQALDIANQYKNALFGTPAQEPASNQEDPNTLTFATRYGMSPQEVYGNNPPPLSSIQGAQPVSNSQAPGAPSQPQQVQGSGSQSLFDMAVPDIPGIDPRRKFVLYAADPASYMKAYYAAQALPDSVKTANFAFGGDLDAARNVLQSQAVKAGTIDLRDMGSALIPDGRGGYTRVYGPNENSNIQYVEGPDHLMHAIPIEGGAEAAAGYHGLVKRAESLNSILPDVELSSGAHVPMLGSQAVGGSVGVGGVPPASGGNNIKSAGPIAPGQIVPILPANRTTIPAPTIGQSTAQKKIQEEAGETAGTSAKVSGQTEKLLAAIQKLRDLNDVAPDSEGIPAEWKANINKRVPGILKGDAGAAAQWDQLNSIGILGGIQSLGLGRLDIPIVKQVQSTGGIPMDIPRAARKQMLDNLETEVKNNRAAIEQQLNNLNNPNTATPAHTPMTQFPTGQQSAAPRRRRYNPQTGRIEDL